VAVTAVTIGPVAEEVFFRGFLYNALGRVCPIGVAVCLQAVLFAAAHRYEAPVIRVLTVCLGLALAGLYEWRRTLVAPVFVHAMWNCISVIALVAAIAVNAKTPFLGVHGTQDAQGQFVVDKVFSHTGAETADLRPGDVILSYNTVAVNDFPQLVGLVRAGTVGDMVCIEVVRAGTRLEKRVRLGSRGQASGRPTPPAP
jgi:hypothetical protein